MNNTESTSKAVKKCFVIMPIRDVDGYEKGHFNDIFENIIKPAAKDAGFDAIRANDTFAANHIMIDIVQKLIECEFAICDISTLNPNVFYELGICHALHKKTILIKDNKTEIPFDINNIRTISYSESMHIKEVRADISKITETIKATLSQPISETNILSFLLSKEQSIQPINEPVSQYISSTFNSENKSNIYSDNLINNIDDFVQIGHNYKLPNGETISDGDNLYKEGLYFGKFVSVDSEYILIKRKNNIIRKYPLSDSNFMNSLSNDDGLPF